MKKHVFILICIALFNCSKEINESEYITDTFTKQQNKVSITKNGSLFNLNTMKTLLNHPDLYHFHFKITFNTDNSIKAIKAIGVNENHQEIGTVNGSINNLTANLESLRYSSNVPEEIIEYSGEVLSKHIIQPQDAYNYINNWNILLTSNDISDSYISYNNETIQYYIIEKDIITNIVTKEDTKEIGIFWGLNDSNKLTPVFMGINQQNQVMINYNTTEYILDLVSPVPPFGNNSNASTM